MGRASTRQKKNIYQLRREELGLTREKASDVVSAVSPARVEKKLADKVINADLYNEHKNK